MNTKPPSRKFIIDHLEKRRRDMTARYESTPRGENGHTQRRKINPRWFMAGLVAFSKDVHTGDTTYPTSGGEVAVTPGWFVEKWDEDRSDLINSMRCPKRKDGSPDDSLIDFVVAKSLIAYYISHRPEVVRERIDYCYAILVRNADDLQRLHRKKDPSGYAKKTVNSVLRNLGVENLVASQMTIADIYR